MFRCIKLEEGTLHRTFCVLNLGLIQFNLYWKIICPLLARDSDARISRERDT